MKKLVSGLIIMTAAIAVQALPIQPGIGIHYNIDLSVTMDDQLNDPLRFDAGSSFDPSVFLFSGADSLKQAFGADSAYFDTLMSGVMNPNSAAYGALPVTFSRSNLKASPINFGGKVYLNIKPVVNAGLEGSFNIGFWQYDAVMKYPVAVKSDLSTADAQAFLSSGNYGNLMQMDSISLDPKTVGLTVPGFIKGMQYTKINVDLTLKKFLKYPADKVLRLYLGAGGGVHMGTPLMTPELVNEMLASTLSSAGTTIGGFQTALTPAQAQAVGKQIVDKLLKDGKKPVFGPHIAVGAHVKLPVVPIGIYLDGKYTFIVGDLDKNAKDLKGNGLRFNAGLSLGL